MRNVTMVITGHTNYHEETAPGIYRLLLIDDGSKQYKLLHPEKEFESSSPNRCIIYGLLRGLDLLKYPCNVRVCTKIPIGIKKMNKINKGPNGDLLEKLSHSMHTSGHTMTFIVDIPLVEALMEEYIK